MSSFEIGFDVHGAREAGYSDEEIAQYLHDKRTKPIVSDAFVDRMARGDALSRSSPVSAYPQRLDSVMRPSALRPTPKPRSFSKTSGFSTTPRLAA
jgi:hypothetical protein